MWPLNKDIWRNCFSNVKKVVDIFLNNCVGCVHTSKCSKNKNNRRRVNRFVDTLWVHDSCRCRCRERKPRTCFCFSFPWGRANSSGGTRSRFIVTSPVSFRFSTWGDLSEPEVNRIIGAFWREALVSTKFYRSCFLSAILTLYRKSVFPEDIGTKAAVCCFRPIIATTNCSLDSNRSSANDWIFVFFL